MIETGTLWTVIILLGLGSFGLRFVFTGLVEKRAACGDQRGCHTLWAAVPTGIALRRHRAHCPRHPRSNGLS